MLQRATRLTALAFGLFLVGFGIKMGMWPFGQIWLPDAHPAAPSPVSAMLSGVMIKTGVYGLMRYFLWLVPRAAQADYPLARWGLVVAVLGTITLFTGTMQALKQEQTKRLLAFHSIGQVGYILLGTGACMALLPAAGPKAAALAAMGLFGALFHVLNHGLFKALLFLNAGSMLHATGTQDLNKMGGLMKFMPLTAVTALVASFSISGVPLFNGFVSKWTIYVAAVQGSGSAGYLAVCAGHCHPDQRADPGFVHQVLWRELPVAHERAGQGEGRAANGRLEVGWMMQMPQVLLALICVLLGVVPAIAYGLMHRALAASPQGFGQALGRCLAHARRSLGRPLRVGIALDIRSARVDGRAGAGVSGGLRLFQNWAPRRAAPRLPGFAVTRAKRNATAMWRTASTARSNVISAGSAARLPRSRAKTADLKEH